jgi:SAM-dependent methyltransferase
MSVAEEHAAMKFRFGFKASDKRQLDSAESTAAGGWRADAGGGLVRRAYGAYRDYVEHQSSKLRRIDLREYDAKYRSILTERLRAAAIITPGSAVLCLGARIGTECRSFVDLGCFAVGVDVNPGEGNQYVVHGDFHRLQFPDTCVDIVFTNCLDHAYDLNAVIHEARRVLKEQGLFLAEIVRGSRDDGGREPGDYESLWWDSNNEIIGIVRTGGFELLATTRFDYPWGGDLVVFRKSRGA